MRKILQLSLLAVNFLAVGMSTTAAQQQIAYVDSDALLSELPARKQMDVELESFRKQLNAQVEEEQKKMQLYVQEVAAKIQNGELSPKQQQEEETKVQEMRTALQAKALQADQKLSEKEQELSKPIIDSFNAALKKVAEDNGYTYIVDKQMFLYLGGGIDVTEQVRAAMQ